MKKALQISLARTLFTVEEDAYARLDSYLASIRAALAQDAGRDDIIADVESRIAEKFLESGKSIITIDEVSELIASMGEASAFQEGGSGAAGASGAASEGATEGATGNGGAPAPAAAASASKKLYRDPKNALLGGVAAGLAAYFGVDVVWIRLLFILAAFGNGIGILAYLVLWLVVPEAKSAAQRLEMEGVPVNLTTIAENARDTMSDLTAKHGGRVREIVGTSTSAVGRFIHAVFRAVFTLLRVAVAVVLILGTVPAVLALSVFVPFILANPGAPYFAFPLTDAVSVPVLWGAFLSGYMLLALPCVLLFLVAVGLLRRKPVLNARVTTALSLLWVAALMVGAASWSRGFSTGEAYVRNSPAFEVVSRTVTVTGPVRELDVRNGLRVTLVQGEAPSMDMTGRATELDTVRVSEKDGILTISRENFTEGICLFCDDRGVSITLTVPQAEIVRAKGGSRVTLEKWKAGPRTEFEVANGSRVEADGAFEALVVNATGGSRVILDGTANALTLRASNGSSGEIGLAGTSAEFEVEGGSSIQAERSSYDGIQATARNGARIELGESKELTASASGGSRITYQGTPKLTKSETNGGDVRGVDAQEQSEDEGVEAMPESPESPEAEEAPAAPHP